MSKQISIKPSQYLYIFNIKFGNIRLSAQPANQEFTKHTTTSVETSVTKRSLRINEMITRFTLVD